jgi:hypothetical protein
MSKQGIALLTLGVTAAAQIYPCRAVTAGGVHAATDLYGIANSDGRVNDYVAVDVVGAPAIEAGAAIPAGTKYVIADAQGRAIPGGTAAACLGKVVPGQSASAAGEFVQVLLQLTI